MSMTDIEPVVDAEIVEPLDRDAAEKLDGRLRRMAGGVRQSLAVVADLVELAKRGQIHVALGFASWTAYLADALGGQQLEVKNETRRELVCYLAGEGMSQRAIAETVGVGVGTVNRDIAASPVPSGTPEPTTGLDGKTYKKKPPPPPEPVVVNEEPEDDDGDQDDEQTDLDVVDPDVIGDDDEPVFADDQEAADCFAMADVPTDEFEAVLADARAQDDLSREHVAQLCRERTANPTPPPTTDDEDTPPDIPDPPDAVEVEDWFPDRETWSRLVTVYSWRGGRRHDEGGSGIYGVSVEGYQDASGELGQWNTDIDAPMCPDPEEARAYAHALLEAADELEARTR